MIPVPGAVTLLVAALTGGITTAVQRYLLHLHHPALVYLMVAVFVFAEVGVVVGFFVPGEVAAVLGGVLAAEHHVDVVVMAGTVMAAAVAGNASGYALGSWVGPWLLRHRPLAGSRQAARARDLIDRRGGPAVLVGRFIAVVRALVPAVAGVAGMPVPVFALFSVIGAIMWGALWVAVGDAVGTAYSHVLDQASRWTEVAVAAAVVAVVVAVVVVRVRGRRRVRPGGGPATSPDAGGAD